MSIFDKINDGHKEESEQLRDAQQVLQSSYQLQKSKRVLKR